MTKKDYIALADAFRLARVQVGTVSQTINKTNAKTEKAERFAIDSCVFNVATVLANDNPAFDRARFLTACGVQ